MSLGGLLALLLHPLVDLVELDLVHLIAFDQIGLARIGDLHLLQHLTDDHLDVLVVDRDALQPIDLLDLVDEEVGKLLHALDRQDVMRGRRALDDVVALLDDVAILQMDVLALRDEVLDGLYALLVRLDRDPALVLVVLAEPHRAGDFRDGGGLLRTPCLEQLRHPRQTAGDVARFGAFGRDTGENVARLQGGARIDRNDRVDREQITRLAAARELRGLAVRPLDDNRGTQILLAARRAGAPIDDHALSDAGRLVERLRHGLALDQILEGNRALDLGQHRTGVRIPLGDALAALDVIALVDLHACTVLNAVHGALGAILIDHGDRHVAGHGHQLAIRVAHDVLVLDTDRAFEVRLDEGLLIDLRRATDVECAHGELRARLADRLGRDHADRLTHVDRSAAREITPIALSADAIGRLAGEHRTDAQLLHARGIDRLDLRLLDQLTALDNDVAGRRLLHVLRRGAAKDACAQRGHHLTGVDDRARLDAGLGLAVLLGNDRVLRDVDQTAREVTRVRGLQRGVRETLAGTVRRVEVLEHRETFLEVGDDRALDDLAGRLGHQAAHTGKLLHLRGRAARTGVRHHVDGVDGHLAPGLLLLLHSGDFLHHRIGDPVGALRPGIDHLVVLLALRDQAVLILLFVFLSERPGFLDHLPLGPRHDHVVLAERNARLERMVESERHDAIAEDHRLLLSAVAIDGVDHRGDLALRHQLVASVERNLGRAR